MHLKHSFESLTHVVQSRTYDRGHTVFVTSRGNGVAHFRAADLEREHRPRPLSAFGAGRVLEGQDLDPHTGSLLVVDIERSLLLAFEAARPLSVGPRTALPLATASGALHVRCCASVGNRSVAAVSLGFRLGARSELVLVDVSDAPRRLAVRARVPLGSTGLRDAEGIMLQNSTSGSPPVAFVGGFNSTVLVTVDLAAARVVNVVQNELFVQLVGARLSATSIALGLWGSPVGGVALFDTSDATHPALTRTIVSEQLAKVNRVKVIRNRNALALPLETRPIGGLAVVSLGSDAQTHLAMIPNDTIYCAVVSNASNVITFGFNNARGNVFALGSRAAPSSAPVLPGVNDTGPAAGAFLLFAALAALLWTLRSLLRVER